LPFLGINDKLSAEGQKENALIAWTLTRGFESRLRHGCLASSFCVVLSCAGRGICDGLIIRPKDNRLKEPPMFEADKVLSRTVKARKEIFMSRGMIIMN
jgi:hypothetical protein